MTLILFLFLSLKKKFISQRARNQTSGTRNIFGDPQQTHHRFIPPRLLSLKSNNKPFGINNSPISIISHSDLPFKKTNATQLHLSTLMGFNQTIKFFCTFLLLLLISIVAFSSASSCHIVIQPSTPAKELTQYQVFYIKNTNPFILEKEPNKNRKEKRKMMMMKRRKEMIKNFKTRSFSAMLPKGSVPPSGSSPCHNQKPNSKVTFFCDLSTTKP